MKYIRVSLFGFIAILCFAAHAEYSLPKDGYSMFIQVVPRIGGFDFARYDGPRNAECKPVAASGSHKMNWDKYRERLDQASARLDVPPSDPFLAEQYMKLGIPNWDIITTKTSIANKECGYRARRVLIGLKGNSNGLRCELLVDNERKQESAGTPCIWDMVLKSNMEIPFTLNITDPATGRKTSFTDKVPEDVLIVSLGDSYASGEGNPDIPLYKDQKVEWMDRWCHRSVYAGPIRAGLHLLRDPASIKNERYQKALQAQALTIASFACSGAWVSSGLTGWYAGTESRSAILKDYYESMRLPEPRLFGGPNKIRPQTAQLESLLTRQDKKSVDLLLLSGGGNDVLFAPIIEAALKVDISSDKHGDLVKDALDERFDDLGEAESELRKLIGALQAADYSILNVVSVQYPDLTYSQASGGEQGKPVDCSGWLEEGTHGLWGKMVHWLSKVSGYRIQDEEIHFLREHLISRLNKQLDDKKAGDWYLLNVERYGEHNVRDHGLCKSAKRAPYVPQGRWFRSILDSQEYQGDVYGGFHPTWEFNDLVSGQLIAQHFRNSVEPEAFWNQVKPSTQYESGDTTFVPAAARLAHPSELLPGQELVFPDNSSCIPGQDQCLLPSRLGHRDKVLLRSKAVDPVTKQPFQTPGGVRLTVDAEAPQLKCRLGDSAETVNCNQAGSWLRQRELTLVASDIDSGMKSLRVRLLGRDGQAIEVPVTRPAPGQAQAVIAFPADGLYGLQVCAVDNVGNASGLLGSCDSQIPLKVDTTPPQLSSIVAYGRDWGRANAASVPVVPLFGDAYGELAVQLEFAADISGIKCAQRAGTACKFMLSGPQRAWERAENVLQVEDLAGNQSSVNIAVVRLPGYSGGAARSEDAWRQAGALPELGKSLKAVLWLTPELRQAFAAQPDALGQAYNTLLNGAAPAEEIQAAVSIFDQVPERDKEVLVSWLNYVSGRQVPALHSIGACPAIMPEPGARAKMLLALRASTRCALLAHRPAAEVMSGE